MQRLIDKDGKVMEYITLIRGALLIKGKRQIYLLFKSVNASKNAKKAVAENSFNKLFNKGKKIKVLGPNVSSIKFDK